MIDLYRPPSAENRGIRPNCRSRGGRLVCKVNTDKTANRLDVVDRIVKAFVRQPQALLRNLHAHHALQANRWATPTITCGVMQMQRQHYLRSRCGRIDLRKRPLAPDQSLFVGKFNVGKTRRLLQDHRVENTMC